MAQKQTKKSTAGKRKKQPAAKKKQAKPIRREVGAVVCLLLAVFTVLACFHVRAALLDLLTSLCKGTIGSGFYILPFACLMLGTVFCNLCPLSDEIMAKADRWTSPLFAAFFVISGAELELSVFADKMIVLVGIVYIVARSLGKYLGAHYSAKLMHCQPTICKYLGIALLPQAGVALGMCVTAKELGAEGDLIRNITLFAILIYELVGPMLTKLALIDAGEIQPMSDDVKNRRQINLENAKKK